MFLRLLPCMLGMISLGEGSVARGPQVEAWRPSTGAMLFLATFVALVGCWIISEVYERAIKA